MKKINMSFKLPLTILITAFLLTACAGEQSKPTTTEKPSVVAAQLLGQNVAWINEHFGKPAFKRHDGQAEMLQYKSETCVLNIFVYEDVPGVAAKALHFDTHNHKGGFIDRDECLDSL